MLAARVFFLAAVFKVRTSAADHARRFDFVAIEVSPVGERRRTLLSEPDGKENKNIVPNNVIILTEMKKGHLSAARDPAGKTGFEMSRENFNDSRFLARFTI